MHILQKEKLKSMFVIQCWLCIIIALFYLEVAILLQIVVGVLGSIISIVYVWKNAKLSLDNKRLWYLYKGSIILENFLITLCIQVPLQLLLLLFTNYVILSVPVICSIVIALLLFWVGIILVYVTSIQLGIRWRIIGILCGWLFPINIYILIRMKTICEQEIRMELEQTAKIEVHNQRCKTKYPILLVHGIFFRDTKYLNYWGRIPKYLIENGATIFYGNQESARTVEDAANELAKRIQEITKEYHVDKVNIIAHSKGGLDSRYAISNLGIASNVASLTTINTPHHGCIFANYLLQKAPLGLLKRVTKTYNTIFTKLGDTNPDFMHAIKDLTDARCKELNTLMKDQPNIYYHSITSYTAKATNGRFPLNITYPIVKHFDGKNDGLVAVDSANYWDDFTIIDPPKKRGITHADMIDLNRENIDGFDVREFYASLIEDLKRRRF
jgi:triacylglycerol lipase